MPAIRTLRNFLFFCCSLILLLSTGCGHNPLDIDVSDVALPPTHIDRMEQDLFAMDTNDIEGSTRKLQAKYGNFYTSFITGIINNGGLRDSSYEFRIRQFLHDSDMRRAYSECQKIFPSTENLNSDFDGMFRHYRFYFPQGRIPRTVTMMSGFNYPVVMMDSTLAVGLEMYLGTENQFYSMLAFPRYKSMFMNPHNIMPDAARYWMIAEFPYNMDKSDFLSQIIYMGKIMYMTDALLPDVPDTLKMQYTSKQMDYCVQNEFNVWSYFAAQKLLYTTDQAEIMKFTADGPFTSALSKESAPRIGYWVGWQIVRQYMKNNPSVTIPQLMKEGNAQNILARAKYKPGK